MEEKGVWRTVRGRRIFIKEGQNLRDAMAKSGKFKNLGKSGKKNEQLDAINSTLDKLESIVDVIRTEGSIDQDLMLSRVTESMELLNNLAKKIDTK